MREQSYLPDFPAVTSGFRNGRSIVDGYRRGWGLQFGNVRQRVLEDPLYQRCLELAKGRTIQDEFCRMNLFLLLKFYLNQLPAGNIIEFGSYRGGSAIFMAAVCRELGLSSHVYALDTFEGMPTTDPTIDAHRAGDFNDIGYDDLVRFVKANDLSNLHLIRGTFEDTAPGLIGTITPIILAHIDCDIHSAVAFSYETVKPHMASGGYIAFDDCHVSSCLGATEAVEDLLVRRDHKNAEQVWPHWVFRA